MTKSIHRAITTNARLAMPVVVFVVLAGCDRYKVAVQDSSQQAVPKSQSDSQHAHRGEAAGGIIATLGSDEYHVEAIRQQDNRLAIYILAGDETRLQEVDQQELTGYVKTIALHAISDDQTRESSETGNPAIVSRQSHADGEAAVILFRSDPLPSDSPRMTSRFVGELPERFCQQAAYITIPGLRIQGERFVARFEVPPATSTTMPVAVDDGQARRLYLTPGGLYSESDIHANGAVTAGEKYKNFRPQHDTNPPPGALICPISQTKANETCCWIIGGERYVFCCPPCIDEFLEIAKSNPKQIRPADSYRMRNTASSPR